MTIIAQIAKELNVLTPTGNSMMPGPDPDAEKMVYARAYQAWAECKIEGTAEDVFETIQEILDV